jgi:hypothetical protein
LSFGFDESPGAGAVSVGFPVSAGWPLTSPGRDDMPGSFFVSLVGLAGRATLPDAPWSAGGGRLRVSVAEVVGMLGAAGVVELVLFWSTGGVSDGEVRCMELDPPLRP